MFGVICRVQASRAGFKTSFASISVAAVAAILMPLAGPSAHAETLSDALAAAYESNPRIEAERARLRATDEEVPRALSGFRPIVTLDAEKGARSTTTKPESTGTGSFDPWAYQINLTQPVFSGFRTVNGVNEAEAIVRGGRENLRQVETDTLLAAVTAYCDVVRDQAILKSRERNVSVLASELQAAQVRRAAQEVTKTDVAQAQARSARAVSDADLARANLKISRATYARIVGHQPASVIEPPLTSKLLPSSLDMAIDIGGRESPAIVAALYREEAARYNVDKTWGELLPEVRVEANFTQSGGSSNFIDRQEEASVTGRLSVPLYEGGEVRARVRQAKHTQVSRLQEIEEARTQVVADVTSAWSRLIAARAQLKSDQIQIDANKVALEGVREEERVGQRTLLEVLNAEQEYLEAQVQMATTRRDLVVANYALLGFIGHLTGESIATNSAIYDAEAHYNEVRRQWFGISITHDDGRTELVDVDAGPEDPGPVNE